MARKSTKEIVVNTCEMCGKEFEHLGKARIKCCSEKCDKERKKKYNTTYNRNRYRSDDDYRTSKIKRNRKSQDAIKATARWEANLGYADSVLKLAQEPNAKELIAVYFSKNFSIRGSKRIRAIKDQDEIKATENFDSLGDNFIETPISLGF